jgi:mono/diheme cytochrome c family protein
MNIKLFSSAVLAAPPKPIGVTMPSNGAVGQASRDRKGAVAFRPEQTAPLRSRLAWFATSPAVAVLVLTAFLPIPAFAQQPPFQADSNRGAELFGKLSCVQCHRVNGLGGDAAPDLGRLADRNFTPAGLAATMWNHAPAMWSAMSARGVRAGDMDEQAAADLFAYFYSARFFEREGDAARGKRVFNERHCANCHGIAAEIQPGIPAVAHWQDLNRPLALIEDMWNHMRPMLTATKMKHTAWPTLSGQDFADLLVYLRNLPETRQLTPAFIVTPGANGASLFASKGCQTCHNAESTLAKNIRGRSLTAIAADMWNHGPRMAAAGAPPAQFQPGEMRELLSYVWARQFFEDAGDPTRGRHVFNTKHCASCHGTGTAPALVDSGRAYSGPAMIAALWRHGPAMLDRMNAQQVGWPRLDAADMAGLIAYLNGSHRSAPGKEKP